MVTAVKAAYIHIPFCSHICYYCDFNKVFIEGQPVDEYVDLLIKEIQLTAEQYTIAPLETLYIGGGTPSTLSSEQLTRLFEGIHRFLPLQSLCEFTMELNPDDGTSDRLAVMKAYGVNRISMGVQSFNDELLQQIGRRHRSRTVFQTIELARKMGFENISIDLIFRLPKQTITDFQQSLQQALALDLPHYSIYSLILEQKTVFYNLMRQGKLPLPTQDEEADMFHLAMETMEKHGRSHYEISNYARKGYESRHNLQYWNANEYLGFGAGAHGYLDQQRYQNFGPIQHYLQPLREGKLPILRTQLVSKQAQMEEFMFLGLRKMSGISFFDFFKRFGVPITDVYHEVISDLLAKELIQETKEGICLSQRGKFLGNHVFQAFLLER